MGKPGKKNNSPLVVRKIRAWRARKATAVHERGATSIATQSASLGRPSLGQVTPAAEKPDKPESGQ
jgi:hypothetical protein